MRLSLFPLAFACAGIVACATTASSSGDPGTDSAPTSPEDGSESVPGGETGGSADEAESTSGGSTSSSSSGGSSSGGSSSSSSSSSSSGGSSSGGSSSSSSSSGGSSSGSLPDTCTTVTASCAKGGSMTYCISYSGNVCSQITYEHDGVSASCSCTGGTDCTDAYYTAYTDCQDAVGACDDLDDCCDTIGTTYESTCRSYVSTYKGQSAGDISCQSILTSWRSSKLCP